MKHFAGCQSRPTKRTPVTGRFLPHLDQKRRGTIKCEMDGCTVIKEAINPKTLNKFRFALVLCWIVFGAILCGAFSKMETSDHFRCDGKGVIDKDFIRGKCYDEYRIQNHKLGIPPYAFMLINVSLIPVVTLIYSIYANSTADELERSHESAEAEPRNRRRTLFIAYLCQLVVSIALEITFIVSLETHLFYPTNFPSDFSCSIKNLSFNRTQSTDLFKCFNQGAGDKNVWIKAVTPANGIFALFAFLEIIWILTRARNRREFMENWKFYADHLKSNSNRVNPEAQAQTDFQRAIQTMRENILRDTEQPSDLRQPFGRPNHGEGDSHDLTMDDIYVNVAIHEGRAHHYFADPDRLEQLREYPPDASDCCFKNPEDILDKDHKNVLVVGRPGIGKTLLGTKIVRLWASGEAFHGDENYKVIFRVKFRRFNADGRLSLRELLARAETVQRLDDSVWEFVQNESTKVLLIFDGLDEYSRKEEMNTQEDYVNNVEERMPVSVLYKKLAAGELLRGASILTTTRPTAVKYIAHVNFQRTVEIRGFTSENVKEYVEKFTRGIPGAKEEIWRHIKSNINLFSLSYIPMNCFLICHCLLQITLSKSSQAAELPTKMTDIYKMTVKMLLFNHNRECFSLEELEKLKSTHMYEPFEKFPDALQKILRNLGEIAFKGIEEGRLLFKSSEVSELEDCGLLHKLPDLKPKALGDPPKSQFCFTHLTVQEFFAAKHLVDTESNEGIEEFVCNYINKGTWQVVLQFVAGLLKSSSDIFIKQLLDLTETGKTVISSTLQELTFWPATEDKHLAVQLCKCLYEINDEQQPILQNKIENIKFNAVEFLSCSLAPIDVAAVLHFLENAEEVLEIDLSATNFGDLGGNEVKKFIVNRQRKLKWLKLSDNNFTDNAGKDFAAALEESNCKLELLDLCGNNFTDNAAKHFAAALKHSNCKLESLSLGGNNFTDSAAKDFATALKHSNCNLAPIDFAAALHLENVEEGLEIDLPETSFGDFGGNRVTKFIVNRERKLKRLKLSDNNFTDDAGRDFAAALEESNCKLELLDLGGNNFTDNAAKHFAAALKHSNCKLELLDLGGNNFTDNAAKHFAAALEHSNCKLKSLNLGGNDFTDTAAENFVAALKHSDCKLQSLDLGGNNFTDNAAKDFAAALEHSNCKLESLNLGGNNFTDSAANDFAAALKHSNCKLESLELSAKNFTDNAVKDFVAALKHSNCKLKSLCLGENNLSDNAAKDLAAALKPRAGYFTHVWAYGCR